MDTKRITKISIFMAMSIALTFFPKILTPTGYIHLGDSIIILSAFFLGPIDAMLVGGIGHAMADIISGYAIYAIPTLLIKGLFGYAMGKIKNKFISMPLGILIVITGYFIFESIYFSIEAGLFSILTSFVQVLSSVIVSLVIYKFTKNKLK
ncbi:MAG: ECF transporter S component [Clostridia bacterium]|nr:ECF transporter S component [Clostridia bacterium]